MGATGQGGGAARVGCYVIPNRFGAIGELAEDVARWERAGVRGVLFDDHLFLTDGGDRSTMTERGDPFVLAAAVAASSERLEVGTIVANIGLQHPALVLRHFAQLAALFGGDRILAGIGAGWNAEEFAALGLEMPDHATRARRLLDATRRALPASCSTRAWRRWRGRGSPSRTCRSRRHRRRRRACCSAAARTPCSTSPAAMPTTWT
ncbi:MAG TPA: LLM class flavin-dependent oxidoreductase [Acidimicrobiales bacterium]|nr:LLM class flavin-dependent oxidoreductase [Acidimicrobiales bacterium]